MPKECLDHLLLLQVMNNFKKNAFVPMPGGSAEPVAGASPMTAAIAAPMAPPPGSPGEQQAQQGLPPEAVQILSDPQVQQVLQQAGFAVDPTSGAVIDPATSQPMPPDQVMQLLQEVIQMISQQSGAPQGAAAQDASQPYMPPAVPDQGAPALAGGQPYQDPMTQVMALLTEIRDMLAKNGGGEHKPKKQSIDEKIDALAAEVQRTNETLRSMIGQ